MRTMSPALTALVKSGSEDPSRNTVTSPSRSIWNVLSWLPYSSAFFAMSPTFATLPMVATSNLPFFLQSSMHAANTPE